MKREELVNELKQHILNNVISIADIEEFLNEPITGETLEELEHHIMVTMALMTDEELKKQHFRFCKKSEGLDKGHLVTIAYAEICTVQEQRYITDAELEQLKNGEWIFGEYFSDLISESSPAPTIDYAVIENDNQIVKWDIL